MVTLYTLTRKKMRKLFHFHFQLLFILTIYIVEKILFLF
jgi:hypothetical protein